MAAPLLLPAGCAAPCPGALQNMPWQARALRSHAPMQQSWTRPQFEEVNLGSEIGTDHEDQDDPSFLFTRKTGGQRRGGSRVPEPQRPRGEAEVNEPTAEPCV